MNLIKTFGKLEVSKGESGDPKDLDINVIGFEFNDNDQLKDGRDAVLAILDYIKEQLN